jgi:hypothetical protein
LSASIQGQGPVAGGWDVGNGKLISIKGNEFLGFLTYTKKSAPMC